jgi:hypothetical protein
MRHGGRKLDLIPFEASARKSLDIPRDKLIKCISLNFEAVLVLAAGAASGTVNQDSTLLAIPSIEIYGDGSVLLHRSSARILYWYNMFNYGTVNTLAVPASGDAGNHTLSAELIIDFQNNIGRAPQDTLLNAPAFRSLVLYIQWASLADLFSAANDRTKTIAATYGVTPVIFETDRPISKAVRIQDYITKQVAATQTDLTHDLTVGNRLYQALMFLTRDANVRESDIINYFSLITNDNARHYDRIPFVHSQRIAKRRSALETLQAGLTHQYMLEDGLAPSGLMTNDTNSAKLMFDVTVGAGTTYIDIMQDFIVPM